VKEEEGEEGEKEDFFLRIKRQPKNEKSLRKFIKTFFDILFG
jgi:hypothetical protein